MKTAGKVLICKKNPGFAEDSSPFLTVLFRHGHVSPSLPSDWKPRECRCSALSRHFCCGSAWPLALSCPLTPSAFFRVWVMVWVKRKSRSKCGAHLRERKSQLDCPLPLFLQVTVYHERLQNTSPAPTQNLLCCKQYGRLRTLFSSPAVGHFIAP